MIYNVNMENPLIPWLIGQIREGYTNQQIYQNYTGHPFAGEFSSKSLWNRMSEVRVVLTALDNMNPPEENAKQTTLLEQTKQDSELTVALKTYDIKNEEDLRAWLSYQDHEKYRCKRFKTRASQNAINPWWIVEGTFEERITFPPLQKAYIEPQPLKLPSISISNAVLSISDYHAPFHDKRVAQIMVRVAAGLQPSHIMLNGDMVDATDLSKWPADIDHRNRIQESLIAVGQLISQLRTVCPESKIVYLEGNHCARLQKELLRSMAGAIGLKRVNDLDGYDALSVPNLLCLKEYGVEWVPYKGKGYFVTPHLNYQHGDQLNINNVVKAHDYSVVMGHGHRVELTTKSSEQHDGQAHKYVMMTGCGCHLDGRVPAVKNSLNWQQSLGVVYYDEKSSSPVPLYINDGKAIFNGKVLTATQS